MFYDQREHVKDSKPLGFGWMHDLKFCFSEFQYTTKKNDLYDEEIKVIKNLTQDELNMLNYVKREKDVQEHDPKLRPVSFMMT